MKSNNWPSLHKMFWSGVSFKHHLFLLFSCPHSCNSWYSNGCRPAHPLEHHLFLLLAVTDCQRTDPSFAQHIRIDVLPLWSDGLSDLGIKTTVLNWFIVILRIEKPT